MRETPQTTARVAIFKPADGQNKDPFGSLLDISLSILIMICSHNQIYFKKSCITLIQVLPSYLYYLPIKNYYSGSPISHCTFKCIFFRYHNSHPPLVVYQKHRIFFEGSLGPKGQFYLNFFLARKHKKAPDFFS